VRSGRGTLLELPNRTGGARPPQLHLIDLRKHAATQGIATPTLLTMTN
jgi:primosomal protein N'